MIQRVQSLFLAVVAACMFAIVFLPIWQKSNPEAALQEQTVLTALALERYQNGQVTQNQTTVYIAGLCLLSAALAVGSMFSYKSRPKQMMLNFFNTLCMIAVGGVSLYLSLYTVEVSYGTESQGGPLAGFFLVWVALIFNSLANRFIRADEKLVRSADTLR